MRSSRIRSLLVTAVVLGLCGLGWLYLAPTQIGGSTHYVITHGISMEPLLHQGDLVLVRPTDNYQVGEVAAYHSTLLHTVVLHRIVGVSDGHYAFKGDNNSFIDPTHPTRSLLIGTMWLHIPHGGTVLEWVHRPWAAAALAGGAMMLLLFGGERRRRRRRRRHGSGASRPRRRTVPPMPNRPALMASSAAAVVFAILAIISFIEPESQTSTATKSYTQTLSFGYHGPATPGSVYPSGGVRTGDPIYPQLVHRFTLTAAYRLTAQAPTNVRGTVRIRGTLSNTSGWSRSFWLGPPARLVSGRALATALVDLTRYEALASRIASQIGGDGAGYTLAIVPEAKLNGTIGTQRISTSYSPVLDLAIGGGQVLPGGSTTSAGAASPSVPGASQTGLVRSAPGSVTSSQTIGQTLAGIPVGTVRWIAVLGFVLFAGLALLTGSRELQAPVDPVERINRRYRHLIVPVASITPSPEHPPIEVGTIDALAQLAQRSERLILHEHLKDADNYLIDDQGTLFRFQALRIQHTNGNGNGNGAASYHDQELSSASGQSAGGAAAATAGATGVSERTTSIASLTSAIQAARESIAAANPGGVASPGSASEEDTAHGHVGAASEGPASPAEDAGADTAAGDPGSADDARQADDAGQADDDGRADELGQSGEPPAVTDHPRAVDEHGPSSEQPVSAPLAPAPESMRRRPTSLREAPIPAEPSGAAGWRLHLPPVRGPKRRSPPRARTGPGSPSAHWSRRPEARIGLALGPLALTILAWRGLRLRRLRRQQREAEEQRREAEAMRSAAGRGRRAPAWDWPAGSPARPRRRNRM